MKNLWQSCFVVLGLALSGSGCFWDDDFDDDDVVDVVPPPNAGTLTVRWSIAGRMSAADCAANDASFFELVILDQFGGLSVTTYVPCEAFSTSVQVQQGTYGVEGRLVDGAALPVGDERPIDGIVVSEDRETVVTVDFPAESLR